MAELIEQDPRLARIIDPATAPHPEHLLAEGLQRLAHQFLVRERAVDLDGVEEGDAALKATRTSAIILVRSGAGPHAD